MRRSSLSLCFLLFSAGVSGPIAAGDTSELTEFRISRFWAIPGASNHWNDLEVGDPDGDGRSELLSHSNYYGDYWYQLSFTDYLQVEYASVPSIPLSYSRVRLVPEPGPDHLLLVVPDGVEVVHGASRELLRTIPVTLEYPSDVAVGDLDGDGDRELVVCGDSSIEIRSYESGELVDSTVDYGCEDLSLGQIDTHPALEIALSSSGSMPVILDSETLAVEWSRPLEVIDDLRLVDLTGDGLAEVVWTGPGIHVWDPRSDQSLLSKPLNFAVIAGVGNFAGDSGLELVVAGDERLSVIEFPTGTEAWGLSIPNFECCTGMAIGQLDADPALEIALKQQTSWQIAAPFALIDAATHQVEVRSLELQGSFPALAAGDLDSDAIPELVFGARQSDYYSNGRFLVFDHRTGTVVHESGYWSGSYDGHLSGALVAELDGTPPAELCFAGSGGDVGLVRCLDGATRDEELRTEIPGNVTAHHLVAADLDVDGSLELLVATTILSSGAEAVYAIDSETGGLVWASEDLGPISWDLGPIRVGDVIGDADLEVVVATGSSLVVLSAIDGSMIGEPLEYFGSAFELLQLDGDPVLDILVEDCESLRLLNPVNGNLGSPRAAVPACLDALRVSDVTRDGIDDFVYVTDDRRIGVTDGASGSVAWQSETLTIDLGLDDALLVADLDGDTIAEIAAATGIGFVVVESPHIALFESGFESGDTEGWLTAP